MTKLEWGSKRTCLSCMAKFYDFLKSPIICPKCGAELDPDEGRSIQEPVVEAKEEVVVIQESDEETNESVVEFPDEEELVHIDDPGEIDPGEDDADLQGVIPGAGG